jgi:hypothetical protein
MFEHGSTLVLSRISCIASGFALLEDKQKFKLGGCVGAHETPVSLPTCRVNVLNNHVFTLSTNLVS